MKSTILRTGRVPGLASQAGEGASLSPLAPGDTPNPDQSPRAPGHGSRGWSGEPVASPAKENAHRVFYNATGSAVAYSVGEILKRTASGSSKIALSSTESGENL